MQSYVQTYECTSAVNHGSFFVVADGRAEFVEVGGVVGNGAWGEPISMRDRLRIVFTHGFCACTNRKFCQPREHRKRKSIGILYVWHNLDVNATFPFRHVFFQFPYFLRGFARCDN